MSNRSTVGVLSISLLISILFGATHARSLASVEDAASKYIVRRILPHYPVIASKLLTVLLRSRPDQDLDSSSEYSSRDDSRESEYLDSRSRNGSSSSRRQEDEEEEPELLLDDVLLPRTSKRSMGHCIHQCINGRGQMNFIQCKSMCH